MCAPSFPFIGMPTSTYPEWERGGASTKVPRRKASSFRFWRSDRGGGEMRRASDHPPLRRPFGAIKGAHRAASEVPGAPTLSCSSAKAGWQAERFDFGNVIPRHLGENGTGPVHLMDPRPPCQSMAGSDTRAWAAENVRMSGRACLLNAALGL